MSDSSRKAHPCNNCSKSFSSSHQLAQHSRVHSNTKPYKCSLCDKTFKQLCHVQQHTRIHTGERPYKCSDVNCGRSFTQLSNLQQHLRTHSNGVDKPERSGKKKKRYVNSASCPVCGKTYVNEGSLRKHVQTTHADVVNTSSFNINNNTQSNNNNNSQINFLAQINNGDSINAILNCAPADMKGVQNNTGQLTNNSANNLFIINNHNNGSIVKFYSMGL